MSISAAKVSTPVLARAWITAGVTVKHFSNTRSTKQAGHYYEARFFRGISEIPGTCSDKPRPF